MALSSTGTEQQNAAGTGVDAHGIVTDDRNELARIPKRVPPFWHCSAEARPFGSGRYSPFYHSTGALWFIMDNGHPGRSVFQPPEHGPPLPLGMEIDRLAELDRHKHRHVYFIGTRETAIKIGVTGSVKTRFDTLQAHSPVKLEILATRRGGEFLETAYHARFAAHRLHGEWFSPHPDILAEIDRLEKTK